MCGPQIRLYLFNFRPIASKRFNSLTTNHFPSWLGGAVVTHPLWVQEIPGSIPGSGKGFYVWFFVLLLCFCFFVKNHIICHTIFNFFCYVDLFSILNLLQDLWPIIRAYVHQMQTYIFKYKYMSFQFQFKVMNLKDQNS